MSSRLRSAVRAAVLLFGLMLIAPASAAAEPAAEIAALKKLYYALYDQVENRVAGRPDAASVVDSLFGVDGEWIAMLPDGTQEAHRGRAALIAMIEGVGRRHVDDPGRTIKHAGSAPIIEVRGDCATLRASFLVLHRSRLLKRAWWVAGSYDDTLERDASGRWVFRRMIVHVEDATSWKLDTP